MSDGRNETRIEKIDCLTAIDGLYAYLDGEMTDPQTVARFEKHLEHCMTCRSRTEMEAALSRLMKKAAEASAPTQLQARLKKLVDGL